MSSDSNKPLIKVWMDGCFDLVHFGHADACRQAKLMGHYLIVGIHSDAEITNNKGKPVTKEEERYKLMRAIKWVDYVVENAPYVPTIETLNKYQCDFCVHGEELAIGVDGTDYHEPVRRAGRYKDLIRTIPISTTALIQRMLKTADGIERNAGILSNNDFYLNLLREKIDQFSIGCRKPKLGDRIVYAPGIYDLLHVGHIDFLEKAKTLGDYLIVGVYSDKDALTSKKNIPLIMNVYERSLGLLSCRFVDQILRCPTYNITEDFLNDFKIDLVVYGLPTQRACSNDQDPFRIPKLLGKVQFIDSGNTLTNSDIIQRVLENRNEYEARNIKKEANETEGYKQYMAKIKS